MSQSHDQDVENPLIVGGLAPGAFSPMTLLLQCNSVEGVRWLRSAFLTIAAGEEPGDLAHSPVMGLGGVSSLRLQRVLESPRNHIRIQDGTRIQWTASADEWVTMTYLLDPLLDGATGHQYLTNEGIDDVLVEVSHGESHAGLNERASADPSVS
jgi:hypothetical protein